MNRTVKDCDGCKKEIVGEPVTVSLPTGRTCSRDEWQSKGPPPAVFTDVDLCSECAAKQLYSLVRNMELLESLKPNERNEFEAINNWIESVRGEK